MLSIYWANWYNMKRSETGNRVLPFFRKKSLDGGCKELESKIEVISTVKLQHSPDLYKVVDALNRTLKEKDLMFGLALDPDNKEKAIFTIYRT
jgi:Protein of unknown function (DUF4264)